MRIGQPRLGRVGARARILGAQQAFLDQLCREHFPHGRMVLDGVVHQWLGIGRLVGLVVPEAPIADEVDDDVAAEFLAEGGRQADRTDARRDVVGVDVDDRQVEPLGDVGRVARGATFLGVGREAELVVGDDVQRPAGCIALELREIEDFRNDALRGEGRVAVDQDGDGAGAIVVGLRPFAARLLRARPTLDDRVNGFQMARIREQADGDLLAIRRDVGALGLGVVFHVPGDVRPGCQPLLTLLELHQEGLVGAVDHMGDDAETAAVRHAHDHLTCAIVREQLQGLLQHHDHRVEAFDRESLLAEEGLAQVAVHGLDLGEASQQLELALRAEGLAISPRFDPLAQPVALFVAGNVLDFVGDR